MQDKRSQHNKLQVEYFDKRAEVFQQEIPVDIQERTAYIVKTAGVGPDSRILDVGTGAGVLLGHFLAAGAKQSNLVGVDLSERMLMMARLHFHEVFFWNGDVMEFSFDKPPSNFPKHISNFNFVFFNACFANMHDRKATLQHVRELLTTGGKVTISHPAPEFVNWLHHSDPEIVPHLLPSREEASAWSSEIGYEVVHFESTEKLYLTVLART